MYEKECVPVRRKVCGPVLSYAPVYQDTCDTEYETICTTILATKYVKVGIKCIKYQVQGVTENVPMIPII